MTGERKIPRIKAYDVGLFLCFFLLLAAGRWDALAYPIPLNPDEAQMAANAMRIREFGIGWGAVDGTTSGPLNSLVLAWPYLFGGDVTFSTTRLTALVLLGATVIFVYCSIASIRGRLVATLLSLSLAAFYAFTRMPDFLQYASEILPISLLVFANFLLVDLYLLPALAEPQHARLVALGVAIGAVPFAKLQAAPIAAVECACVLLVLGRPDRPHRTRRLSAFALGCLLPAAAWLGPLALTGGLSDFFKGYIVAALIHLNHGADGITRGAVLELVLEDPTLISLLYLLGASGLFSALYRDRVTESRHEHALVLTLHALLLVAVALFAVLIRGKAFYHYLLFLPPFLVLVVGYWAYAPNRSIRYLASFAVSYAIACLAVGLILLATDFGGEKSPDRFYFKYRVPVQSSFEWNTPHILRWLAGPDDRLLVWGWMPGWYVWSGLPPATRESITQMQIYPTPMRDYYRQRLMDDFAVSRPDFVMDAVAGKSFGVTDWLQGGSGISSDASLYSVVQADFEEVADGHPPGNECAGFYVRRERLAQARRSLVEFARIAASARKTAPSNVYSEANVADNRVTEDACTDYWLLPEGKLGELNIDFVRREPVRRVLILNTGGGILRDRATKSLRLDLLDRGMVTYSTEVTLRPHPRWTEVVLDRPRAADALRLEILSYAGLGAGLNEVKVFRESQD